MSLKLSFHGGAGTVTGSRHLLTHGRRQTLVDCGMFQGLKELRRLNWQRPTFDPRAVGDILLTHAHLDHSGYLPRIDQQGFRGAVHCTPATRDLSRVLLLDSARLQEEDAAYANRKGFSKHRPALPLYTEADAQRALRRFRALPFERPLDLGGGATALFRNSGHILGSAFVELTVAHDRGDTRIVFSGDLGRYGMPLHVDPEPPSGCDVLVIESTYGDREHDRTPMIEQVRGPFRETIERGGVILIPSFAVARVQLVLLMLRELMDVGELPRVPVHVDSPMAVEATRIYREYADTGDLDPELASAEFERTFPRDVQLHATVEESKRLNDLGGPRIIVSSSGMLTGGRVLHHLRRLLPAPSTLVVLVGYQPPGTRGRALQEGAPTLRMHGEDVPVRARTISIEGLSAHADAGELLRWLRSGDARPRAVFVTHGEPEASAALAARIEHELSLRTIVPRMGDEFDLEDVVK